MPWDDWNKLNSLQRVQIEQSDVISFHHYGDINALENTIRSLEGYGKVTSQIICNMC